MKHLKPLSKSVLKRAASQLCQRAAIIGSSRLTKDQRVARARLAGLARGAQRKAEAEARAAKSAKSAT